ncbi:MAG: glycosyltransferase family 2 protein [Lachnospiraceae bacterium]|nr:glycosyltransferase family 2 protein [Lachnospiraceae bacterium]
MSQRYREIRGKDRRMEITILFPCLNEEKTVAACVRQAGEILCRHKLAGEVLVCDNGSEDGSAGLAAQAGARVVFCPQKGYGNALRYGITKAGGRYVIMADCDGSYRLEELDTWILLLREGAELIVGDRFAGKVQKGAMPFLHRYLGVPLLSALGRLFFGSKVRDFHCGLRAVRRSSFLRLQCRYGGMEFATEMIGRAAMAGQRIEQLPVTLYRDGRGGPSHLRSFRDGGRHLKVILTRGTCRPF